MNAASAATAMITPKREAVAAHEPRPHAPAPQPPPPSQPVQRPPPQSRQPQSTQQQQQQAAAEAQQPLVSTGKYEWWTVDEVRFPRVVLPILIRHDGLFLSVRTIEYSILSQYDKRYKADIDQIGILCSFECNEADAALLNEINEYVNYAFGPTFTTQDALVKLEDFRNFFKVLTERLKTNRELSLERREQQQQRPQQPSTSIQMHAAQAQQRNHTPPAAPRISSNPPPLLQQSIAVNQASILAAQQQQHQQRAQSIQNLAHPIQRQANNVSASSPHLVDQLNRNSPNRGVSIAYLTQQAVVNQAQAVNYGHAPHSVDHGQSFVGGHVNMVPYSRPHLPPGTAQFTNVHQTNTSTSSHIAQQHHQPRPIIRAAPPPPPPPMNNGLARHHNQIISNGVHQAQQQQPQHAIVVHNGHRVQENHNMQRHHAITVTSVPPVQPHQALSRSATGSFHEQHQQQLLRTLQMQQQQMQMAAAQVVQQAQVQRQAIQAAQQTQQQQQQTKSLSHALANFQIANLSVTPPPPPSAAVTNVHSPRGLTPPGPVPVSLLQQPVRNQPDFILHPVNKTLPPPPPQVHRTSPASSSSLSNGHGGSPRDRSPIPPPPCLLSAAAGNSGTGLSLLNSLPPQQQPAVIVVAKPPPPSLEPIAPPRRASATSSLSLETRVSEPTPAAARRIDSARSSRGSSLDIKSDSLRLVAAAASTPNRTSTAAVNDEDVIFLETTTRTDPDRSTSLLSTTVSSCSNESRASSVLSRSSSLSSGAEAKKAGCIQINSKFFPYLMLANLAPLSFLKPDGKYSNKYVEIDHVIRLDVVQLNSSASLERVFSTLYQTNTEETLYLKQFVTKINYPYKDFYMGKQSFLMVNLNEILFYASTRPVFVKGLDYQQPMGKFLVHFEEVQEIKGGILSLNLESGGRDGKLVPYVFTKGKKLIALEFIRAELDKIGEQTGLKLDPKKLDIFQVNTHAHKVFFRFFKMLLYYVDQKLEIAGKVNKYIDISEWIATCPMHFESILRFSPEFFPMEWPNVLANRLSFIPRPADPNNPNKSAAGATTIIQVSPADQPITTNTPELQEDEAGHAEPAAVASKSGPAPFAAQNYLESVSFSPTSLCSMSPSISPQEAARSGAGGNGPNGSSGGDSNPASGVERPEPASVEPAKASEVASEPARTEEQTRPLETDNDNHSTANHYSPISSAASSDDEEEMNISQVEAAPAAVQEPVAAPATLPEPVVEPPQTTTTAFTEPSERPVEKSGAKSRVRSFSDSIADCPSMRDFLAIQQQRRQEPGETEAFEAGVLNEALDMVRKFKQECSSASSSSSSSHVQEMIMESEPSEPRPTESLETPVSVPAVEQSPVDEKPTIKKRGPKRSNTAKKRTAVYVSPVRSTAVQQDKSASATDAHGYNEFIDSFGVRKTTTTTTRTKRKRQDSKRLAQKRQRPRTQTRRGGNSASGSWYENDDDDDFIDERSSFGTNDYEDVSSESTAGSERSRSPTVHSKEASSPIDKLFRGKSDLYSTEEFDEDFYAKKYGYRQFVPEFRMRRVDDLQPINSSIKIADLPAYTSDRFARSIQAPPPPKETVVPKPKPPPPTSKADEDSATTPKEPLKKTASSSKLTAEAPAPPKKAKASAESQLSKKPPKAQTPGKTPAKKTTLAATATATATAAAVASPATEPNRLERIKVECNGSFTHELMAERPSSSAVPTLTAHDQIMSKSSRAATIPTSKLPPGVLAKTTASSANAASSERPPAAPTPPLSTLTTTTVAAAADAAVVATQPAKKTVLVASKPALVDEDSSGLPDLEL